MAKRNRNPERIIGPYRGKKSPGLALFSLPILLVHTLVDVGSDLAGSLPANSKYSSGWTNPWMWLATIIAFVMWAGFCSVVAPDKTKNNQTVSSPQTSSSESQLVQKGSSGSTAVVISTRANLRIAPVSGSVIIREIGKGEELSLMDEEPTGPWYKVWDSKRKDSAWIHGNTIEIKP